MVLKRSDAHCSDCNIASKARASRIHHVAGAALCEPDFYPDVRWSCGQHREPTLGSSAVGLWTGLAFGQLEFSVQTFDVKAVLRFHQC